MILDTLRNLSDTRGSDIEQWFAAQRAIAEPFIYNSVDLRHSCLRLAPVDTNLYPAGFNNLSPAACDRAARFLMRYLDERYPGTQRILLIPENHTRNLAYLDNLASLLAILEKTGREVRLGSLVAEGSTIELEAPSGRKLIQEPLVRNGDTLQLADGFTPDLILMNNDMTSGVPDIICSLAQPVLPPVEYGWWQRRKSVHFAAYKALIDDFCRQFSLDPWLLSAEFHRCGMVDFKERTGLDCTARGIEAVLNRAKEKYKQYGIKETPYVFVKAESGTYGMGIMTVRDPQEIFDINKKTRNKMQVIKEGARVSEVIIQEGIPTADLINGKPAEPLIYLIDGIPTGGMWRINGERDAYGNLNATGMEFTGMCDEREDECGQWKTVEDCQFHAFGIVAAIAALAAAREDYTSGKEGEGI